MHATALARWQAKSAGGLRLITDQWKGLPSRTALVDLERSVLRDGLLDGTAAWATTALHPRRHADEVIRHAKMKAPHGYWRRPRLRSDTGPAAMARLAHEQFVAYNANTGPSPQVWYCAESHTWLEVSPSGGAALLGLTERGLAEIGHVTGIGAPCLPRVGTMAELVEIEAKDIKAGAELMSIHWDGVKGSSGSLEALSGSTVLKAPVACSVESFNFGALDMTDATGVLPYSQQPLLTLGLDHETSRLLLAGGTAESTSHRWSHGLLTEAEYEARTAGEPAPRWVAGVAMGSFARLAEAPAGTFGDPMSPHSEPVSTGADGIAAAALAHSVATATASAVAGFSGAWYRGKKQITQSIRDTINPPKKLRRPWHPANQNRQSQISTRRQSTRPSAQ